MGGAIASMCHGLQYFTCCKNIHSSICTLSCYQCYTCCLTTPYMTSAYLQRVWEEKEEEGQENMCHRNYYMLLNSTHSWVVQACKMYSAVIWLHWTEYVFSKCISIRIYLVTFIYFALCKSVYNVELVRHYYTSTHGSGRRYYILLLKFLSFFLSPPDLRDGSTDREPF